MFYSFLTAYYMNFAHARVYTMVQKIVRKPRLSSLTACSRYGANVRVLVDKKDSLENLGRIKQLLISHVRHRCGH